MKKTQFENTLKKLRKLFIEDPKGFEAVEVLAQRGEELSWDEEVNVLIEGDFPVPTEIANDKEAIALFSDGACRGNPGPGSWGMMGQAGSGEVIFEGSGVEVPSTNNRMELEGAIQSLERLKEYFAELGIEEEPDIFLYSDSKYVVDGITSWVKGWKARGWKKADKKVPENVEFWQRLDHLVGEFEKINFKWVKGHAGHPQNEHCDQLANKALDEAGF